MLDNIGKKLKTIAIIFMILGVSASVIYGLILISEGTKEIGIIVFAAGGVGSIVVSFFVYGYGQLVENSDTLVKLKEKEIKQNELKFNQLKDAFSQVELVESVPSKQKNKVTRFKEVDKEVEQKTKEKIDIDKIILKDIAPSLEEKIKKIANVKSDKQEALKQTHPDWNEEINHLTDSELIDRIDNDHDWQYSYVVMCCLEYQRRLSSKKSKK